MLARSRARLASGVLAAAALGLTACGGVPAGSVVSVDGENVSKRQFDQSLRLVAFQAQGGAQMLAQKDAPFIVPDPPEFTRCVKEIKPVLAKQGGGRKLPDDQVKKQCKQFYDQIKKQAVQGVIVGKWARGEAEEQDVQVPDKEVDKAFQTQVVNGQFGGKKQYQQALGKIDVPEDVLRDELKSQLLIQKLQQKALKGKGSVTTAEAKRFYDKNPKRFTTPAKRDLEIVLTEKEADAKKALEAIKGGESFAKVAKRYSDDQATRAEGGKLKGATADQLDRALAGKVFKAKPGDVVGPVQTSLGYYVVRAGKGTPAKKQPFSEVRGQLIPQLAQQEKQKAGQKWEKDLIKRWKDKTECREGFIVGQLCSNAPEKEKKKS